MKNKLSSDLKGKITNLTNKYEKKEIVFISGKFNFIHPGHLRLINFAKSCGDILIVGLYDDDYSEVFVCEKDRSSSLTELEAIDEVFVFPNESLVEVIKDLRPSIVVKGREFSNMTNLEKTTIEEYGGRLLFSADEAKFSSRDLIRKELLGTSEIKNFKSDSLFLDRHSILQSRLIDLLDSFSSLNVVVVGDLIIDEYVYCEALGMSQEDPTIVVSPIDTARFVGGAGIVSAHVAGLGAKSTFITVVGDDDAGQAAKLSLEKYEVEHHFITDSTRPTTLKQRYRSGSKTLLRVNNLKSHDLGDKESAEFIHRFLSNIEQVDLVIFSDFNYGCLPQNLVDSISQYCKKKKIPYFADSQASSQMSDVSRFKGSKLISATEREVRLATNDFKSGIQQISNNLIKKAEAKNLIVKLGAEGLVALANNPSYKTDSLVAFNSNPVDTAGAGDALLATVALAKKLGATIWEAAYLGNVAAAIQVSRLGNIPMKRSELVEVLMKKFAK